MWMKTSMDFKRQSGSWNDVTGRLTDSGRKRQQGKKIYSVDNPSASSREQALHGNTLRSESQAHANDDDKPKLAQGIDRSCGPQP